MSPNKHPFPAENSALSVAAFRRAGGPRRPNQRSPEQQARLDSIRERMRSITRPNGEPPRTLVEILDDAINLENDFQSRSNNSSESTNMDLNASASSHNLSASTTAEEEKMQEEKAQDNPDQDAQ